MSSAPSRPASSPGTSPFSPQGLREAWHAFFRAKGHTVHPSASLVPANDPTLLFTGAGMNQFKDMFLGKGSLPFRRASTVQRCLRQGDLDNVGRTLRHFTFFEMLGNFSFDDYFKEEAISWAWEFTTQVLRLPPDRVTVTIYRDDDESFALWRKQGIPADRIRRFGAKANFWPANAPDDGPNGPCGPCTEMYYDFGPGTEIGDAGPDDLDSGRWLEFWNLVFPQFDRRGPGDLAPLGRRNVDTGAGLERMLAVSAGHNAPFHTPGVMPIIEKAASLAGKAYVASTPEGARLRRVADHARAATFCVADGVKPSNEGRGYVVRRILRRAIRDGIQMGLDEPFLHEIVPAVVAAMSDGYPHLREGETVLRAVIRGEEEQFRETYAKGLKYLEQEVESARGAKVLAGPAAFRLYDTYGFPLDLAEAILSERGMTVDRAGFEKELEAQRERARAASKLGGDVFGTGPLAEVKARGAKPTEFLGYEGSGCEGEGTVVGIVRGDASVAEAGAGQDVTVVLDRTPFYAEGGGQVGDRGSLASAGGARVAVRDTQGREGFHLHVGRVEEGTLRVGDHVKALVDREARDATRRNHTATHLLHEALKRVLGRHVQQQGSYVGPDRLRFDFSHPKSVSPEETKRLEEMVNRWILENPSVDTTVMDLAAAKASGAVALFGENYGERVRVLGVSDVSKELCGGTHVRRAGDIGSFRVTAEGSVASGVRRIEAVTGLGAVAAASADRDRLREIAGALKSPPDQVRERLEALQDEVRSLRRAQEKAAEEAGARLSDRLAGQAVSMGGLRVLVASAPGVDAKGLRGLWDAVAGTGVEAALLLGEAADKAPLLAAAKPSAVAKGVDASDLLRTASKVLGGGGGGRPDMAQGQGASRARADEALTAVSERLKAVLSAPAR
jgi:alanyl-tRNA synthetase